jgi:hypothetical protein
MNIVEPKRKLLIVVRQKKRVISKEINYNKRKQQANAITWKNKSVINVEKYFI